MGPEKEANKHEMAALPVGDVEYANCFYAEGYDFLSMNVLCNTKLYLMVRLQSRK